MSRELEGKDSSEGACKNRAVTVKLYQSLGFAPWDIEWAKSHPSEVYVKLQE